MRKLFWIVLVLLLSTAIGSTAARADSIVTSGGNVTGIDGITIGGITYDVTFGTTEDTTFATDQTDALAMAAAIASDLGAYDSVSDAVSSSIGYIGVDAGTLTAIAEGPGGPYPTSWHTLQTTTVSFENEVTNLPYSNAWAESTVVVPTPEPGSFTLLGVGLLAFGTIILLRKQIA